MVLGGYNIIILFPCFFLTSITSDVSYLNNRFLLQRYGFYFKCQSFIIAHCSFYFFFFCSISGLRLTYLRICTFLNHIYTSYDLHIDSSYIIQFNGIRSLRHSHFHNSTFSYSVVADLRLSNQLFKIYISIYITEKDVKYCAAKRRAT